ncbi:MAG: SAM-dependent methyltransferase, partial [Paramuribaculum sp.]|nr:SAM-dependent methyltransferase [Paramuribaculum sp.]
MVRYQKILVTYFEKLRSFYLNDAAVQLATAELSFRPFLDEFFVNVINCLDPSIAQIFEPRNQGKYGRPDWVFTDTQTMGIYGYVEAKGITPDCDINVSDYKGQVSRYLNLGNPVLLTDGIQFVYFSVDGAIDTFYLFKKPLDWDNPQFNLESFSFFQKFFSKVGFRTIPENMIITELSKRTKSLCGELTELLQLEEDETETETELVTVRTLKRLWDTAAKNLDISLSDNKTFAGFISQILAFGLLYAHRFINDSEASPSQNYERLHIFWTTAPYARYAKHVEPFVHLFKALSDELNSKLSKIGGWYDNTRRLLSYVKLSKSALDKPNFHKLYEDFLAEYDRDTRVDYGAWYTPTFLSDFMAKFVDFLLNVNPELKALSGNPFHVIDPCCGTGTILESVLDNISLPDNSVVVGFEILPVPYALANYRLSLYETDDKLSSSVL